MTRIPFIALTTATALAAAGCGGGTSSSQTSSSAPAAPSTSGASTAPAAAPGGHELEISAPASGELRYEQTKLTAKPGKVTIAFANPSQLPHDVVIASKDGKVLGRTPQTTGGKATATVNLTPGKYTFYCSVAGHRQAGMTGTLVVSP